MEHAIEIMEENDMPDVTINSVVVSVPEGTTILSAAKKAGFQIPTLCAIEDLHAVGACRICVVDVEGAKTPMPSCVTPVRDGMKVFTNTKRVRQYRKMMVELLLSEHDGICQTCDRFADCELRKLANSLSIREIQYTGEKKAKRIDISTPGLMRDNSKCILCRRCVTMCNQIQGVAALFPQKRGFETSIGPAFANELENVFCVQCGQCAALCPVGAIAEHNHTAEVWAELDNEDKFVVVQTAPAIRASIAECFGYPPGTVLTGKMVAALRRLGFDAVFDTNFTADLTIMEEGTEFLVRLKRALVDKEDVALPQFTSCCPAWIRYAEFNYPELLPNISSCKSPQQMFGAVAKTYYAKKLGKRPEDIVVVSIMPCIAKKSEAIRPEMKDSGVQDVDYVLTTRELGLMIKESGIVFESLPDEPHDSPMGVSSGAADIFANTGGVMEAALRTAYEIITGRELPFENLHVKPIEGLKGIKTASMKITGTLPDWSFLEGVDLKVAVLHGLGEARKFVDLLKSGKEEFHFIEVMTCPGGCIGGGGQPRFTTDEVRKKRMQVIFAEDEGKKIRKSHENPEITQIYEEFLQKPLSELSHKLLHTKYTAVDRHKL